MIVNKINEILIDKIINLNSENKIILQIGVCDGQIDDPIYKLLDTNKYIIHAIEPIQKYCQEFVKNNNFHKNIKIYNCAISNSTCEKKFYFIDSDKTNHTWLKGCSSLHLDKNILSGKIGRNLKENISKELEEYINNNTYEIYVPCFTLNDFLQENKINNFDILISDTEGEDFNIFKQIDFLKHKPSIYFCEFYNFSAEEKNEFLYKMTELNYICITDGYNILSFLNHEK